DETMSELKVVLCEEKETIVKEWNDRKGELGKECLGEVFEKEVRKRGEGKGVEFEGMSLS
ncbi:hypothetical protein, partial [Bacillus sp. WP8]|uniref:hypothetical protein n=1 Tax=Bacillus sp. WP8 TaxID=756828 RepID=UPI001C92E297